MPNDTISSGDSLLVRFHTDDSIHNKGFTLTYSTIEVQENELIERSVNHLQLDTAPKQQPQQPQQQQQQKH